MIEAFKFLGVQCRFYFIDLSMLIRTKEIFQHLWNFTHGICINIHVYDCAMFLRHSKGKWRVCMHVDKATCFVAWHFGNLEIRKLFLFFLHLLKEFHRFWLLQNGKIWSNYVHSIELMSRKSCLSYPLIDGGFRGRFLLRVHVMCPPPQSGQIWWL